MCFFKQKTAYEMRISDWSSDVGSSDLHELNDFAYIMKIESSFGTKWLRPIMGFAVGPYIPSGQAFEGGEQQPSGHVVQLVDSDLFIDLWEEWKGNRSEGVG